MSLASLCHREIVCVPGQASARKAAEDALRESEEKFLKAFHRAPNLVSITRLSDGAFVDVNDRFLEVSGYGREELIGRRSIDIGWVAADVRSKITATVRAHGVVENGEIEAHAKGGRVVQLLYAGEIVLIGGERCLLSNAVDITQRKRADSIEHARLRLLEFSAQHTLEELLVATLDEAEALTGAQVGFYHFLRADQETLSLQAWSTRTTREMCRAEGKGQHYDVTKAGVWVDCIRERTPVVHNDYAALPHRKGLPAGHAPVIREMVVPVFRNNLIVALLGVGNKPTPFVDDDVQAVFKLADLAWDIAERKRAEIALWENQERYRQLVESSFDWVWEVDTQGRYTFASPRVRDLLGYEPAEIVGRSAFEFMPPTEAERVGAIFARLAAERKPIVGLENTCYHRDGRLVIVETNGVPILTGDGRWLGYRGMDRDVTARRTAERRLRLHGAALEAAANAIVITDTGGRIEWANQAFVELSGWTLAEAIGQTPGALLRSGKHDREFFARMWRTILEGRVWRGEIVNRRKDGAQRTELMNITPLKDERGTITHFIAIKQDITQQKALESASRQSQRMEAIGTIASGIAHDLNNILSPITMVTGLLRTKLPDEQDQEILAMIQQNAMRGASIIRQLLTFSRGLEGQRVPVPPRHLLKEIMALMRETFPREINLHLDCPASPGAVLADPTQLHQVVLNLCVNARDAMPGGGHLSLSAANEFLLTNDTRLPAGSAPGNFIVIEVKDTGAGIPAKIQHRVFDPFFTTKPLGQGTGLGLSTVAGIVRSHGGFVTLDSAPHQGATFRVFLPAVAVEEETPAAPAPRLGASGQGRVILVVEDERNIRETLRLILERTGYRVLLAVNGKDALAQLLERPESIALILTDVMMPVMNGIALLRAIRELGTDVPVIVSSGLKEVSARAELAALGVPDILAKPYEERALLEAIERKLRQSN
jgi:PAS domain S-box-containing protein